MWQTLVQTDWSYTALLLRVVLAVAIFPHGAQKLLGWFGGYGFSGTMQYFGSLGIPAFFGFLAIATEFFGSLALAAGFLGRPTALGIVAVMGVAALRVHLPNGFFMNWFANQKGEGIEYFLLAMGIALVLMFTGSGAWSVDALLAARG